MRLRLTALLLLMMLVAACGPAETDSETVIQALPTSVEAVVLPTAIPVLQSEAVAEPADKTVEAADGEEAVEAVVEELVAEDDAGVGDSAEFPDNRPDHYADLDTLELYKDTITVGYTQNGDPFIGDIDTAAVIIEEYSDFQCPFCQRFYEQTFSALVENEIANGEVALIFYDFPLSFHVQAVPAAIAARCAGAQGAAAYWGMHDQLFDNFGNWSVADPGDQFSDYAAALDLDVASFDSCYDAGEYDDEVQAAFQGGQQRGIRGTPGFFINGELLSGAQPYNVFIQAVQRAAAGEAVVEAAPEPVNPDDIEVNEPVPFDLMDNIAGSLGDPNAPVTIVEFSDFQCPFCKRHSLQTMAEITSKYIDTGRVYYVFKDLPLDQIHPQARDAAAAARCVGNQDAEKYLSMHDLLFSQQESWSGSAELRDILFGYADSFDLDIDAFTACFDGDEVRAAIEQNVQEATEIGIGGTPFFFVDGFPVINGAQAIDVFDQVIELAESDTLVEAIMDAQRRQIAAQQAEQAQAAPQAPPEPTGPVDVPISEAFAIGDPDAPVTIVEYTDYQCPFCERHHSQTFGNIVSEYVDQGIVRYVFKDFPLNFHPQAEAAAVAARCAGEQGSFLEMHSALFDAQNEWNGRTDADTIFLTMATDLGLDGDVFSTCQARSDLFDAVRADFNEGSQFGVRGTPAFFINGNLVSGAQPFSVFQQAIDAALAENQ